MHSEAKQLNHLQPQLNYGWEIAARTETATIERYLVTLPLNRPAASVQSSCA
jgi:hypothetical protein